MHKITNNILIPKENYVQFLKTEVFLENLSKICAGIIAEQAKIAVSNILGMMEAMKLSKSNDKFNDDIIDYLNKTATRYAKNIYIYLSSIPKANLATANQEWLLLVLKATEESEANNISQNNKEEIINSTTNQLSDHIVDQLSIPLSTEELEQIKNTIQQFIIEKAVDLQGNIDLNLINLLIKNKDSVIEELLDKLKNIKYIENEIIKAFINTISNILNIFSEAEEKHTKKISSINFLKQLLQIGFKPIEFLSFNCSLITSIVGMLVGIPPQAIFRIFATDNLAYINCYSEDKVNNIITEKPQYIKVINDQAKETLASYSIQDLTPSAIELAQKDNKAKDMSKIDNIIKNNLASKDILLPFEELELGITDNKYAPNTAKKQTKQQGL